MSPLGAVLCASSKAVSGSPYDHIGVVVRAQDGQLLMLEAALTGVVAYPLKERLRRSKSRNIVVRKLILPREKRADVQEKALEFSASVLSRPYQSDILSIASASLKPLRKQQRHKISRELIQCQAKYADVAHELQEKHQSELLIRALKNEEKRLEKQLKILNRKLDNMRRSMLESSEDLSEFFCSELVAALYKKLGILPKYPPPSEYLPSHFSASNSLMLPLHSGVGLGPEIGIDVNLRPKSTTVDPERVVFDSPVFFSKTVEENAQIFRAFRKSRFFNHDLVNGDLSIKDAKIRKIQLFANEKYSLNVSATPKLILIKSGDCALFSKSSENAEFISNLSLGTVLENFKDCSKIESEILARKPSELLELSLTSTTCNRLNSSQKKFLQKIMKNHELFKTFSPQDEIEELQSSFFPITFKAGEEIMKEGEHADNFYILKKGSCKVTRLNDTQSNIQNVLNTFNEGDLFGEISLLYGTNRGGTITAVTDVELLALDLSAFVKFFKPGSKFMRKIFDRFAVNEFESNRPHIIRKQEFMDIIFDSHLLSFEKKKKLKFFLDVLLPCENISFHEFVSFIMIHEVNAEDFF
jgi:hypothetical protein